MGGRRLCKPDTTNIVKNAFCFYANAGWDESGNFTVVARFRGRKVTTKILQPVKITPGIPQILEVFVKLNKPKKIDGCIVLKHFNQAMVNGTKIDVSDLGGLKNVTLHNPMAMHETSVDRHMVKMGQRSSTIVDDMETTMRNHNKFMVQGAYMIAERFQRDVVEEDFVEFRRVSIKTQNFGDDDPLNPQFDRNLRRW